MVFAFLLLLLLLLLAKQKLTKIILRKCWTGRDPFQKLVIVNLYRCMQQNICCNNSLWLEAIMVYYWINDVSLSSAKRPTDFIEL